MALENFAFRLDSNGRHKKTSPRTVWMYQHADFNTANNLLCEVNWKELLKGNVNEMWAAWEEHFMSVMRQYIPSTKLSRKQNVPWIIKDIMKAIRA